jgi:Protein of unknown function (DUF3995)
MNRGPRLPELRTADADSSAGAGGAGVGVALAAAAVGILYAAISAYWGLGGTWLLSTVGSSLVHDRSTAALVAVWAAVVVKLAAAAIPLLACRRTADGRHSRRLTILAWTAGAVLALYGFVLTAIEVMVQTGVINVSKTADHRALRWHAYLWDPWFLIWGLLVLTALALARASGRRALP